MADFLFDEGKNKSTVSAEIMLSARCGVFEYQEVELVEDCYLKTNELKIIVALLFSLDRFF